MTLANIVNFQLMSGCPVELTFLPSSFLMTGFSLFSCARLSDDSVAELLLLQDNVKNLLVKESRFLSVECVQAGTCVPVLVDG